MGCVLKTLYSRRYRKSLTKIGNVTHSRLLTFSTIEEENNAPMDVLVSFHQHPRYLGHDTDTETVASVEFKGFRKSAVVRAISLVWDVRLTRQSPLRARRCRYESSGARCS